MTEIWVSTHNQGKLREYRSLFDKLPVKLNSSADLPAFYSPDENGESFTENARIKARALASIKNQDWVFAEDSGLEVEGLNGLPGIHSARYAGDNASDAENKAKLLKMLQLRSPQNRKAHFTAVIVLLSPKKEEFIFSGQLQGEIARSESGTKGFGYDSIFIPNGEEQTLAELGLAFKNKFSHRAEAGQQMLKKLQQLLLSE